MAENPPKTSKKSPRMDHNMMGHPVFGDLVEKFPEFRFPTFLQVLNRVRFLKKNQHLNRLDSFRPIYKLVACELDTIWNEAFVVPVVNSHSLATKIEKEVEKKLKFVTGNLAKILNPNHPEKLTAQLSEMKKVFNITKCTCFLNVTHR